MEESGLPDMKTMIRSFVNRIELTNSGAMAHHRLPLPPDGGMADKVEFCLRFSWWS